jgi:hypothetical protein
LNKYLFYIAHKKRRQSKYRVNKKLFCYVCYNFKPTELFSTKYCPSSVSHQICDSCLHQHIVSILNSCLVNSVTCPGLNCRAIISSSVIHDILSKYNNHDLLKSYLHEQNWKGKSEEWIQRFTERCPRCNVPIQKNGGCYHMICSRCTKSFFWPKLPTVDDLNDENISIVIAILIGLIITVVSLYSVYLNNK